MPVGQEFKSPDKQGIVIAGQPPRRLQVGPKRVRHGGRRVEGRLLQDEGELLDGRIDEGGRRNAGVEDGDLFEPGSRERFHDDVAADLVEAGQPVVGPEPAALEQGSLELGGEGEGAAEDADGALAADAPLVAVEAERDPGPDEDVGQDLSGPGPDLDPIGKDLDGESRFGHRLISRLRGPIILNEN